MRRVGFESCRHHLFFSRGFFGLLWSSSSPPCGGDDQDS